MKSKFFQYHMKEHIEEIEKDAIIILDTNALLNIYRYNKENREKYLEILDKIKDRLVLPYQVCKEFYSNRMDIIKSRYEFKDHIKQFVSYSFSNIINKIESGSTGEKYSSSLSILRNENVLKQNLIKIIKKCQDDICNSIQKFDEDITEDYIYNEDPILQRVVEIFDNKVNDGILRDELSKVYKEGEERYKNQVPPGYKDDKKVYPHKFGDLIVWKEIICIAKKEGKNILFISDDRKEDWVEKCQGHDLGPRKELITEFYRETQKLFWSITTKEFIRKISSISGVKDIELLEKETEMIEKQIIEEDNVSEKLETMKVLKGIKNNTYRQLLKELRESSTNEGIESLNNQLSESKKRILESSIPEYVVNPQLFEELTEIPTNKGIKSLNNQLLASKKRFLENSIPKYDSCSQLLKELRESSTNEGIKSLNNQLSESKKRILESSIPEYVVNPQLFEEFTEIPTNEEIKSLNNELSESRKRILERLMLDMCNIRDDSKS